MIRDARTLGVTAQFTSRQRAALATVRVHEGYQALLDVMEQACIEQETRLLNTDVTQADAVLAEHRKTQAMWQMFVHLQQKVDAEVSLYIASIIPDHEPQDAQQLEDEQLLNPTLYYEARP